MKIAVGPEGTRDWVRDAVVAGGGDPAAPEDGDLALHQADAGLL